MKVVAVPVTPLPPSDESTYLCALTSALGSKDESIESIKEYEANFFRKSRLFREGALRLEQMTTENMSKAVSERFWRMVKDSVEQEADTYRGKDSFGISFCAIGSVYRPLFDSGQNLFTEKLVAESFHTS
ncbi:unnamed protein product [Dibothriocephalus latus]|uniref:Uncharacterized protein n=1 Tax=Dibothriocephalus latus TaxID=60516 RepID=A0A3P7NVI4_DIBLA|nr:unnamed protein product [Dibothriocephalus latus]